MKNRTTGLYEASRFRTSPIKAPFAVLPDADFLEVVKSMQDCLNGILSQGVPLFTTNLAEHAFDYYMQMFEGQLAQFRQQHNCRCCARFLEDYGMLVSIEAPNRIQSAVWNEAALRPGNPYFHIVKKLRMAVECGDVVSQKFWDTPVWGQATAGGFNHFAVEASRLSHSATVSATEATATALENRKHLEHALSTTFTVEVLKKLNGLLRVGSLERSDKLLPMAEFLFGVHVSLSRGVRGEARNRVLWAAVGKAAPGWCTPRSSVLGALADDVMSGIPLSAVERRHNERMAPTKYMRPSAPTSEGNIVQANKLFAQMGLEPALRRRPAMLDEVVKMWKPKRAARKSTPGTTGVFGHLAPVESSRSPTNLNSRPVGISFAKFRRDVLPRALQMKVAVTAVGHFAAITAAADADAPPILKWDSESRRNAFAWYLYNGGSPSRMWGLDSTQLHAVEAISLMPSSWDDADGRFEGYGHQALFILRGARDLNGPNTNLFPELLRSELHAVRRTIEDYSRSSKLEPLPEGIAHASGVLVSDKNPVKVHVTMPEGVATYLVDRWE